MQYSEDVVYVDAKTAIEGVLRDLVGNGDLTAISIKSIRADLQTRGFKAGSEYENNWLRDTVDELLAEHQRATSKAPKTQNQTPRKRGATSLARNGVGSSRKSARQLEPRARRTGSSTHAPAGMPCAGGGSSVANGGCAVNGGARGSASEGGGDGGAAAAQDASGESAHRGTPSDGGGGGGADLGGSVAEARDGGGGGGEESGGVEPPPQQQQQEEADASSSEEEPARPEGARLCGQNGCVLAAWHAGMCLPLQPAARRPRHAPTPNARPSPGLAVSAGRNDGASAARAAEGDGGKSPRKSPRSAGRS